MDRTELLDSLKERLDDQKKSPRTFRAYSSDINQFLDYCESRGVNTSEIDTDTVREYLESQERKPGTIKRKLSSLRTLSHIEGLNGLNLEGVDFRILTGDFNLRGLIDYGPLRVVSPEKLQTYLQRTWDLANSPDLASGYLAHRNLVGAIIIYGTGITESELVGLNRTDFEVSREEEKFSARITPRKNGETRQIDFEASNPFVVKPLEAYPEKLEQFCAKFESPDVEALLLNKHGKRISTRSLRRNLSPDERRQSSKNPLASTGVLRSSRIVNLIDEGLTDQEIADLLGNESHSIYNIRRRIERNGTLAI